MDNLDLINKITCKQNIEGHLESIKEINKRNEDLIKKLREENKKLKDEHYKDEELKKMQEKLEEVYKDSRRGFPISEEEEEKINEWADKHLRKKHWDKKNDCCKSFGAIGGNFTYRFIPTSIGVIGTIECSCGAKFTFQDL